MSGSAVPVLRHRRARRLGALVAAALAVQPVLAVPAGAGATDEARRRVQVAAGELVDSTAAVRRAAASLQAVAAQLPGAQRNVAVANGELAGAQARLAEAAATVQTAELATAAAQRRVSAASAAVDRGRRTIDELARRSYQQGPLGDLREVLRAGSPQDVVDRAETLKKVFRGQNDALQTMTVSRLRLAGTRAELAVQQRVLEQARDRASRDRARAASVAVQAQQAAQRVTVLIGQRKQALSDAEAARAGDLAQYRAALAASRRLAERLRALAAERARQAALAGRAQQVLGTERFAWPTDGGYITSRFGYRRHPIYGDVRFHSGLDIANPTGTPVWSAEAGTVLEAGYAGEYGLLVVVSHGSQAGRDVVTAYAHMSALSVTAGQRVGRGQEVGRVGSTGASTGPHLHFEVRVNGDPVDPLGWVSPP